MDNRKMAAEDCGDWVEAVMGDGGSSGCGGQQLHDNDDDDPGSNNDDGRRQTAATAVMLTTRRQQQQARPWKGLHNVDAEGEGGIKCWHSWSLT
jgi:hypothetical protein